jgi:hypothetical protein
MLAILMPLVFVLILLFEIGGEENEPSGPGRWQTHFLVAGSYLGFIVLAISELLSLIDGVSQLAMAIAWGLVAVGAALFARRQGRLARGWSRLSGLIRTGAGSDPWPSLILGGLFVVVLAVALVAPPNNVDSLQYHMVRVEQWAQNRSLAHFPAVYESQNARPYWAELAILNMRLLWGSDRPANLPQTLSLLGSAVAASGIVALLGGRRPTQWLGAVVTFTVPMALLQATAPKNDVVAGWWLLAFTFFTVLAADRPLTAHEGAARSLSLGLAVLTKGTVLPFLAPLLVWHAWIELRRRGVAAGLRAMVGLGLLAASLSVPLWVRNIQTYGGPYGRIPVGLTESNQPLLTSFPPSSGQIALEELNREGLDGDPRASSLADTLSLSSVASTQIIERGYRILRMIGMHFVSPFRAFNNAYFSSLERFPAIFSDGYIASLRDAQWNNEMTAGNPVHLVVVALAAAWVMRLAGKRRNLSLAMLAVAAVVGFLLMSFAGCADWIFCGRYQLGSFFLGAPVAAVVIGRLGDRWARLATAAFLLYAVPYIVLNNMRPVIGATPWPTRIESVFTTPQDVILFAQSPRIRDEYTGVTDKIQARDCRSVGLSTSRYDLEYTIWRLLGAPESGIFLQQILPSEETRRYMDPAFSPCAVICTVCEGLPLSPNLSLEADYGYIRLYTRNGG